MSLVPAPIARKLDASPKIINGWRDAWRMRSVQWSAVGAAFNIIVAAAINAFASTALYVIWPINVVLAAGTIIFILSIAGRLLYQPGISDKPDSSDGAGA